jgi:solute:Na+ symporter, SSS family
VATIDYIIIAGYLATSAVIGLWLAGRAGRSSDHYFLGGKAMPWWALGASGMASNLDIAGTMAIVALIYQFGLHGLFVEFRGGVVLPIAVFLAFMGKWHRRSQVMTTAEWMILRFGEGPQGKAARVSAALTYLVITVAMIVFFFTAGGRFLAEFLPFTALQCTLGMAAVAFAYTMVGGLYGVVWTDVFQAGIIGFAAIYVAIAGARAIDPSLLAAWPGSAYNEFLPQLSSPGLAPYEAFGWFLVVWLLKGVLEGLGGSGGSAYMAQRYYAARSDRECQKIGMLWTVLFAFRWPMVLGFAILAIKLGAHGPGSTMDPEQLLPLVLKSDYFPSGMRGLMIAALLAAAMSTFDSTLNAGASYVVRDLYEPWRKRASAQELVWIGYVASFVLVAVGLIVALVAGATVLGVWVSIVMLLFPAFLVPFALRWYWHRFNGAGFTVGIAAGFIAAVALYLSAPAGLNEAQQFLLIAATSMVGSVAGTLLSPPVPDATLEAFYQKIRPFGTWPRAWKLPHAKEHRGDITSMAAALLWQILSFLLPMGMVLGLWTQVMVGALLWTGLLIYLLRHLRTTSDV